MTSYLVTGGSGYIGTRLIRRLVERGDRVLFLYRDASKLDAITQNSENVIPMPVTTKASDYREAIKRYNVEAVFHLASMANYVCAEEDIAKMIEANITLGTLILEGMNGTDCKRFINTATYWQHYDGEDYNPICLYAATKQAFMDIITYYAKWHEVKCISLKLTDVYGDNDPRPKIFALLDKAARTGETLKLTAGEQMVSFLHVDDAVSALCAAADKTALMPSGQSDYCIGTPLIRLKDAVQLYLNIKRHNVSIEWGGSPYRPTQIMVPWLDRPMPDWSPSVDLEKGLRSL